MKTKHLLTALALPAVFAACTADDIVKESANQAQRAALNENFKLNFGGVDSRLTAGKPGEAFKFDFEQGDKVGGAIIDKYNPLGETVDDKFQTQDYVSTNQPFTFDGSAWTIDYTMVEGKYLFYYPYNVANNSRGAVQYSIPVMQDLSDETGKFNPKAAIEKYAMAVGYQFLDKEDLYASAELAPLFSYARIVLKLDNEYAGGEIEKIVLQAPADEAFALNGQLNNVEIENIFKYAATGKDLKTNKDFDWKEYAEIEDYTLTTESDYYVPELNKPSSVMVGKLPAGTKLTKDAQNNHSFETYMVMPAQEFLGALKVFLYMTDGRVYEGETAAKLDFNRNTPKKVEANLTTATSKNYIVASQADWNENVDKMGKESATFIIADPEFTITNDLKYPTEENVLITVDAVKVGGNDVTMKNVVAGTIIVAEGAKLTTDVTAKATKIVNEGELVVAKNPESRAIVAYDIKNIVNKASLTVNEGAVIATALTNMKGATVNNAGTMTISGTNNGSINNDGTVYVAAANFENLAEEVKLVDGEVVVLNTPTINNAATGKFRADGTFTNSGKFVNNGILSCKNNAGSINNSGVIDAKNASTTYITTNDAKVIVYAMKQANVTVNKNNKTIEYTATNTTETVDESIVTDIIATKDLEIKWENDEKEYGFANLTINNVAKVKLTAPADKSLSVATLNVNANATIKSNFTVATLKVAEGSIINVPADYALTVSTIDNKGTISVVGTLNATAYAGTEEAVGDVEDNGKGTINWKPTQAEQALADAKKAYEDAVKPAIEEWVSLSASNNWTLDFDKFNYNLNDTLTAVTYGAETYHGAAETFAAYAATSMSATEPKGYALQAAFEAYVALNEDAEILDYYSSAVSAYITSLKAKDDYKADMKVFKEIKVEATDAASVFVDKKDQLCTDGKTLKTITAEEQALARFKQYITGRHNSLTTSSKIVLCSETSYSNVETYIPDYTFVFATSNVYKIMSDYITKYEIADATGLTTLEAVKEYVKKYANATEAQQAKWTVGQKKLYNFIVAEDFKVYDESLEWAYSNKTIETIFNN